MLRYGGNPNLKSSDNETALHVAVMWNRESAAKLLLAHGADPTIRNSDGLTAFDLAENTSDHELRCLDLLRNSCLDNSSESDLSSSERPILNVPRLSRKQKSPTSFHQSFLSERRTPNEDAVDGMLMDSGFQSKNPSDSPRSLFNNKPTETYPQFPYNPTWIHPSGIDSFRAPYQPQQMSNGLYAPPQRSPSFEPTVQQGQKDSFFDISIHPSRTTDPRGSEVFTNMDSYNSDTQDSIDTAFTFDSDIDSSTSYFSLPKHSLKGLINELKDGEERIVRHKGVNGEASVIIGSDFESRISLGEIPLSIIKNTNDSIITDQLKKNLGKKSAEKLFLRRAKLYENSKRTGRGHSNLRSSPEAQVTSPFNVKRERPNFFRAPFPLITLPSPSMNHREHINQRHDDEVDLNGTTDKHTGQTKVDKTTQKYLDSSEAEEKMPTSSSHSETGMETELTASVSHSKASVAKRQGLSKQAQVVPSVLQPASSVSINGSADINTRTPTTDETLSQPGNEETENEFSLINGIASPRALYTNMFDTPNVTPKSKTLFDQNFLRPCTQSGKTSDGDIFNFGGDVTTSYGRSQNNSNKVKNFSKIQRRIDVLNQSECDVFPTETESGAGESDSNSSGGYSGDMSQGSSPDDVTSVHSMQKFDIRNSPSVTVRNKRRKGMVDESNSKKFEKQSSTESSDITMAEKADEKKAALPISPRKRLNGVTSSSEERDLPDATLPKASNIKKPTSAPHRNVPQSPGHKIRQRVDHTFEESQTVKSPLVPEDLRVYHKAQLERPMNGRRQWERQHKYDCTCELCMTKKGQTPMVASLPHCEHDQCHESNQSCFDDVTVEFDWKDVSLIDSTNTDHSVIVPDELKALDTEELKQRLVKAGEKPGPITENTKNIYIKHLARIEAGVTNKGQVRFLYSILLLERTSPRPIFIMIFCIQSLFKISLLIRFIFFCKEDA